MRRPTLRLSLVRATFVVAALLSGSIAAHADDTSTASQPRDSRHLRIVKRTTSVFGTEAQLMAVAYTDVDARLVAAHFEVAFAELRRIEAMVSTRTPDAPLERVNAEAGKAPVVLEPELFALLSEATRVAQLSRGAFDPTFAALDGVWRFSPDDPLPPAEGGQADGGAVDAPAPSDPVPPAVPSPALVERQIERVGYRELILEPAGRTAFLQKAGMRVGLGGIARGYALDRAAALLESRGVRDFVIALGGDLVVRGSKGDEPWMVGIQDPRAPGHFAAFPASSGAVMTSGDYERAFFQDGVRYHHIIDPRTGTPAKECRSVTVIAGDGLSADALSTAVFVLGPKEGMRLVERLAGVEAVIVTADNRVLLSKGLADRVKHRPPTDAP